MFVPGVPAPQGSKRSVPIYAGRGEDRTFTGRVALLESSKPRVDAWRADVRHAVEAALAGAAPLDGPVRLRIAFVLPRPKATPKRRPTPAAVKQPDVDKTARSTADALTSAGAYRDDAQIVELAVTKRIAELDEPPGAWIDLAPCAAVPAPPTCDEEVTG